MDMNIIDHRLAEMKDSLASGREQMRGLDAQKRELEQTMLRISGAIQVLEELKRDLAPQPQDGN